MFRAYVIVLVYEPSERKSVLRNFLRIHSSPTCGLRSYCKPQSAAMVCNGWKQRRTVIRHARMSLGWFIYAWASMKFFRHFTVKKTSLPLTAAKLPCLNIQWVAYKNAICKEFLWIKSLFAPKFLVYRGKIKGSETVFRLVLSEKSCFPMRKIHPLSTSEVKMLLITGNI